jgi:2-amino-4-hydroxy-6-hydroxymethyldihydropteridine diphosphokinase
MTAPLYHYAIGLGSNKRHPRHGAPRGVLTAAFEALNQNGLTLLARSRIINSAPIGPSLRVYANAAALIETAMEPPALLEQLKETESLFGLRRGQRWSSRVLDLDILLWSGGIWSDAHLNVPHLEMARRNFVMAPLAEICPKWRHPVLSREVFQILSRLQRRYPVDQIQNSL